MAEKKLKVKLIAYTADPEQVVASAIRQCYSTASADELFKKTTKEIRKRLIKQVIDSGHTSTIEHATFTFAVEGVSRVTEIQLVRHRIASYSIKSGRYNPTHSDFIIPPAIFANKEAMKIVSEYKKNLDKLISDFRELGFKYEDIRYLSPQGTSTNIMLSMNARSLFNFLKERMCMRAQWEIRALAMEMYKQVIKIAPNIFKYAGPTCETEKICWQGNMSCGKWKGIKGAELRSKTD